MSFLWEGKFNDAQNNSHSFPLLAFASLQQNSHVVISGILSLTIIHATIKRGLPEIRPKLLEHNLNRQVDHTVTDSSRGRIIRRETRFHKGSAMSLEKLKQIRRPNQGKLEDLAKSIGNIAPILRGNEGRVEKTGTRRIEGPNTVLVSFVRDTTAVIDSILDSHTGIDNGKKRGGHTDKWNATTVQAGRHTGNIKKDSTSNREEGLTTAQLVGAKVVEELINSLYAFKERIESSGIR